MKLCVSALALVALTAATRADLGIYSASLTGSQEVPPVASGATGSAAFTFDTETGILGGSMFASGFSSTITAAHIHSGGVGEEGPPIVDLGLPMFVDGSFVWDLSITLKDNIGPDLLTNEEFKTLLDSGGAYFNIHTESFPDGEIRGQIAAVPEPGTMAALGIGALALLTRKRRLNR